MKTMKLIFANRRAGAGQHPRNRFPWGAMIGHPGAADDRDGIDITWGARSRARTRQASWSARLRHARLAAGFMVILALVFVQQSSLGQSRKDALSAYPDYTPGMLFECAVSSNNVAYLGTDGGVVILDLSVPAAPRRTGFFPTTGWVRGLSVVGNLLYIADTEDGLVILGCQGNTGLTKIGGYQPTGGGALKVVAAGDRAYLSRGGGCGLWNGIEILDVHDPAHPACLGKCAVSETAGNDSAPQNLCVVSNLVYVAAYGGGLTIIDASDAIHPFIASSLATFNYAMGVGVAGHYAYVCGCATLEIMDVSDPLNPVRRCVVTNNQCMEDIVFAGNTAYVAASSAGVMTYDIQDKCAPVLLGQSWGASNPLRIRLQGNLTYVADGNLGFKVVSVSNLYSPVVIGGYDPSAHTSAVRLRGDVAYVADGISGFKTIDLSNPRQPRLLASLPPLSANTRTIELHGNTAYVGDNGLRQIDISDPAHPVVKAKVSYVDVQAFRIDSDRVYVGSSSGMLSLLGLDGASLPLLGQTNLGTSPYGIANLEVLSNMVYVVGAGRVTFVSVTDPAHPAVLGQYSESAKFALGVKPVGKGLLIVAADNATQKHFLTWVDVSDPQNPVAHGAVLLAGQGGIFPQTTYDNIQVVDGRAFVADGTGGVAMVDIRDPENLRLLATRGSAEGASDTADLRVTSDYVVAAAYDQGLVLYDNPVRSEPLILNSGSSFGARSNQFSFNISWATNVSVVVEAATNLAQPVWLPVSTNLMVNGSAAFHDWTKSSGKFYRLRTP